jgi:hypothetical protein
MPLLTELVSVGERIYKDAAPTVLTSETQRFLQNTLNIQHRMSNQLLSSDLKR